MLTGTNIPYSEHLNGTWGDYDNDGYFDFLNAGALFRNDRNGGFTVATRSLTAGAFDMWGDYDNDGNLDLVAGGLPCVFYRNNGDGTPSNVQLGSPSVDAPGPNALVTWCDYDNDGFLDLLVATRPNPSGPSLLYRNRGVEGGNSNHWLTVRLKGIVSNRSAIGAKVRVQATIRGTNTWQLRQILGSYYDDLRAHFGLGDATNVATLRIEWPSGIVQELKDVAAHQHLTIIEHQVCPPGEAPRLTGTAPSAVGLQLTIQEPTSGARYALEGSTDLNRWARLLARTSAGGTQSFTDTKMTNYPARFYRVIVP